MTDIEDQYFSQQKFQSNKGFKKNRNSVSFYFNGKYKIG